MEVSEYILKMRDIQQLILDYLDDDNDQENFQNLVIFFNSHKIMENKHYLTSVIHLIASIIDYHYHTSNFFEKIFKIILFVKDFLKRYYSNFEIFSFFQNNQKTILFLLEEKIINIEELITIKMFKRKYEINALGEYLLPEIKPYLRDQYLKKLDPDLYERSDDIKELRKTDYGDNKILQYVQNDSIIEFIASINETNFDLEQSIKPYFLETNILLTKYPLKLIDYSAFFGSIKIFKYLVLQKCCLDHDLWFYAIHGGNSEIIQILEDSNAFPLYYSYYITCVKYAIICHQNEIANYIINNYLDNIDISSDILKQSLKSYNFAFIQPEMINSNIFYNLCKRDYFILASSVLHNDKSIDINSRIKRFSEKKISPFTHVLKSKEKTYLQSAIEKNNFDIVQLLLECQNININLMSSSSHSGDKISPLFEACKNGNIKIVQALLDRNGIDVNAKSVYGKDQLTPLNIAIIKNNVDIARMLIERNDININLTSLDTDTYNNFYEYIDYKEVTPLYQACECGDLEIVKLLIDQQNIDINAKISIKIETYQGELFWGEQFDSTYINETALSVAVRTKKTEIVRCLLAHEKIDANIKRKEKILDNETEYSLLRDAVANGYTEISRILLENKNFDVNEIFYEPDNYNDVLDDETIKDIKSTRDTEVKDIDIIAYKTNLKCNLLYKAVDIENIDIVRFLLESKNIDVNIKSTFKSCYYELTAEGIFSGAKTLEIMSPLYLAIVKKNIQIIKLLLKHENIDINMKSSKCKWKYNGTYIDGKEEIEIKTIEKNQTAFHYAVSLGDIDIITLLLNHKNIDINIIDKQGKRPIELTNNEVIQSLIKKYL